MIAIANVAGEIFFAASTPELGFELWVTDGTEAGTRLVKDINPGPDNSFPTNFVGLGGTLYFTANAGVAGTQLWKSDGTEGGTMKVADLPGFGSQFPAQPGQAELQAESAAPSDGVPAVDFTWTLEILRADGSIACW